MRPSTFQSVSPWRIAMMRAACMRALLGKSAHFLSGYRVVWRVLAAFARDFTSIARTPIYRHHLSSKSTLLTPKMGEIAGFCHHEQAIVVFYPARWAKSLALCTMRRHVERAQGC